MGSEMCIRDSIMTMADCEVALKTEFNEVAITRRVFRDGKSEYRINDKACRLRDVHDLFMDTGIGRSAYSIMAQGQIDQILSSKPEERRAVFEEAAGITSSKRIKKRPSANSNTLRQTSCALATSLPNRDAA